MAKKKAQANGSGADSRATGGTAVGHNLKAIQRAIADDLNEIIALRAAENTSRKDMKTVKDRLEKLGIPKTAQALVIKYVGMEAEERRVFDTAIEIAREAMGLPQQISMDDWLKSQSEPDKPKAGSESKAGSAAAQPAA